MLSTATQLVLATHNPGKVREIAELLQPFGLQILSAGELGVSEPPEDGTTFRANAETKARHTAEATGLPSLSDDSGFSVAALGGAPGVYAADWAELPLAERRYTGQRRDFAMAMWRVRDRLRAAGVEPGTEAARAHFTCMLCVAEPGEASRFYRGECHGTVVWPPRGGRGFGYDPVFLPRGGALTFGEMEPADKHARSHRAAAFAKLVAGEFGG